MRAIYLPALFTSDYTWDEASLFVWTATELATTIVAASIPVLRPLLQSLVQSTQRREGRTGVTNTFKTGTYVCTAVGRAQSYRRMDRDSLSQKTSRSGRLEDISEDGDGSKSLALKPFKSLEKGREYDGIIKTEEVQIEFDRQSANVLGQDRTDLGF